MDEFDISRKTEIISPEIFPKEILKEIKLISFQEEKRECNIDFDVGARLFGSSIYVPSKYPADIDLQEHFIDCGTKDDILNKFIISLKKIIKRIISKKYHYFSELKAGQNNFFIPTRIGNLENGIFTPNYDNIKKYLKNDDRHHFFTEGERHILNHILKTKNPTENDYDEGFNILRKYYILRWSIRDIQNGYITVHDINTHKITLKDALQMNFPDNHVKIDMIAYIDNKFIEITNFVFLAYEKNGKFHPINVDLDIIDLLSIHLPFEIEKLYFSNYYFSSFKCVKRMFSLARNFLLNENLIVQNDFDKLIDIISSNIGDVYKIKSELDTIFLIMDKQKNIPEDKINDSLDRMKLRITKNSVFEESDVKTLVNMLEIALAVKLHPKNKKYQKMIAINNISQLLTKYIDAYTIFNMIELGINPPPHQYLPEKRKYNWTEIKMPNPEYLKKHWGLKNKKTEERNSEKQLHNFIKSVKYLEPLKLEESIEQESIFDIDKRELLKKTEEEKNRIINNISNIINDSLEKNEDKDIINLKIVDILTQDEVDTSDANTILSSVKHKFKNIYGSTQNIFTKKIINDLDEIVYPKEYISEVPSEELSEELSRSYYDIITEPFANLQNMIEGYKKGEIRYSGHKFTGPFTTEHTLETEQPYNNIDNCSRQHDIDYRDAKKDPALIRKADEKVLECYDQYSDESGYYPAKYGIKSKMAFEDYLPNVANAIIPSGYSGVMEPSPEYQETKEVPIKYYINKEDQPSSGLKISKINIETKEVLEDLGLNKKEVKEAEKLINKAEKEGKLDEAKNILYEYYINKEDQSSSGLKISKKEIGLTKKEEKEAEKLINKAEKEGKMNEAVQVLYDYFYNREEPPVSGLKEPTFHIPKKEVEEILNKPPAYLNPKGEYKNPEEYWKDFPPEFEEYHESEDDTLSDISDIFGEGRDDIVRNYRERISKPYFRKLNDEEIYLKNELEQNKLKKLSKIKRQEEIDRQNRLKKEEIDRQEKLFRLLSENLIK